MKVLGYGNVKGVDMDYWRKTNASSNKLREIKRDDVFTFIFVGRIVRNKGINELIAAFDKLSQEHKVRLLLVGKFEDTLDPVSDSTKKIIEVNSSIEYLGPQYGTDLIRYIFEPNDNLAWQSIKTEIQDSVNRWLPGVDLTNVEVMASENGEQIFVRIDYSVRNGNYVYNNSIAVEI